MFHVKHFYNILYEFIFILIYVYYYLFLNYTNILNI